MHAVLSAMRRALDGCKGRVLLGVSGGLDSMAMLDAAARLAGQTGAGLAAAHLDHGLREASARDAAFVADACKARGVALYARRLEVVCGRGESLEMAARRARFSFFMQAARDAGADVLMLAHHADDQAETLMIRLLRGAGSTGLSAMAGEAPFPLPGGPKVIRPFLSLTRAQLEQYCALHGVDHIQDESNADTAMVRNRIRHQLMPMLARGYGASARTLGMTARLLGDEDAYLAAQARQLLQTCLCDGGIVRARLADAPVALSRRALLLWLQPQTDRPVGFAHVEAVLGLQSGSLDLPGGLRIVCRDGILRADELQCAAQVQAFCLPLSIPGVMRTPYGTLTVQTAAALPLAVAPDTAFMDAQAITGAVVRSRRPGDRYHALGASGGKKLKDALIDRKVPLAARWGPVVAIGAQVLWMPGLPPAHQARVRPQTRDIVKLAWAACRAE